MKFLPVLRPLSFAALLSLTSVGLLPAQTPDASPAVIPSKPAAETATPSPGAAVNSEPAATATPEATPTPTPTPKKRSAEEKKARKEERLRKYDKNKDGKIDKAERAAMRADKGLPAITEKAAASPTP